MFYFWFTDVDYAKTTTPEKILHISILTCTPLLWGSAGIYIILYGHTISMLELSETLSFTFGGSINACRLAWFYARRGQMSQLIRDVNQLSAEIRDDHDTYDDGCRQLRNRIYFYEMVIFASYVISGMFIGIFGPIITSVLTGKTIIATIIPLYDTPYHWNLSLQCLFQVFTIFTSSEYYTMMECLLVDVYVQLTFHFKIMSDHVTQLRSGDRPEIDERTEQAKLIQIFKKHQHLLKYDKVTQSFLSSL